MTYDLIIIGAGINGAGIARDAAMRGLSVLLLDKGDIGGATSSWNSRLIHGGLRYLEHGEFGLVRESLREREILLRIAPHLVRPIPILVPIYSGARRGKATIRAGMIAYDLLSLDKSLPRHRMLTTREALSHATGLKTDGLKGAALYWDAQVEFPERLVLENVLAAKENGAEIITYACVKNLSVAGDKVREVEFVDELSGATRTVVGRLVVNAAGPWVDEIAGRLNIATMIGGTKGSHIVVPAFPGDPRAALYVEAQRDQRPFFIIPWNSNYLIGTTDSRYTGSPDDVRIDRNEIAYLLNETNRIIPGAELTIESILFTYSGVRPLAFTNNKDEQSITRRHFIRDHSPALNNFISIIGGKLTTYRSLAEQTVDLALGKLGVPQRTCTTHVSALPGAEASNRAAFSQEFLKNSGLAAPIGERLLRIYGTRAAKILSLIDDNEALGRAIDDEHAALVAEVIFAFQHELAQTLSDCLLRRTMIGLVGTGLNESGADGTECRRTDGDGTMALKVAVHTAEIAQQFLGWSSERSRKEIAKYEAEIRRLKPA